MFDRLVCEPSRGRCGRQPLCHRPCFRQQWSGFDGCSEDRPVQRSKCRSGHYQQRSGSFSVYFDKLGQEKSTIARLHYAYHFKLGGQSTFSVGLYAGMTGRALEGNWVAIDPVANDASIPPGSKSATGFDLGGGVYYKSPNLWLGVSSTQLPETELKDVSIQNVRHYYVQAGYNWALGGNKKYTLQPSALLKSDATSTQLDLSALFLYDETVWIGASYRTEDAIAPMVGYQYKFPKGDSMLRLGYSYDVTTSDIKSISSGSHEVMLSYCFMIVKPVVNEIYHHPRFL
jgi:type IX secretion system PorP/SprF family membrane protein